MKGLTITDHYENHCPSFEEGLSGSGQLVEDISDDKSFDQIDHEHNQGNTRIVLQSPHFSP